MATLPGTRSRRGVTTREYSEPTSLDPTVMDALVPVLFDSYCEKEKEKCNADFTKKYELLMSIQKLKLQYRGFKDTLAEQGETERAAFETYGGFAASHVYGDPMEGPKALKKELVSKMVKAYKDMSHISGFLTDAQVGAFTVLEKRGWIDSDPAKEPWNQVEVQLIMDLHLPDFVTTGVGREVIKKYMEHARLNGGPSDEDIKTLVDQIGSQTLKWHGEKYLAESGYYSELNSFDDRSDYQYDKDIYSAHSLPFDDRIRYHPLIISE
eukprot:443331_1